MTGKDKGRDPEFAVTMPNETGMGTGVAFNGQQIENVTGVAFKVDTYSDDVVRSTITIELVGEPIISKDA